MRRLLLAAVLLVSLLIPREAAAVSYGNWKVVSSDPRTSAFHCGGPYHGDTASVWECVVVSGTYWQGVTIFKASTSQGIVVNDTEAWINATLANTTTCTGAGSFPVNQWLECFTPTFHSLAGSWVQEQGGYLDAHPASGEWFVYPTAGWNSPTVQL